MSNMKILFLSKWYPNRYDAMEGLFVRKHAEAASRVADVTVLFVKESDGKGFEIEENWFKCVHEISIYYPSSTLPIVGKIIKSIRWLQAYWKGHQWIMKNVGRPDIVHANVLTRTALIAFIINRFQSIPYIVTEHWSRYLKERDNYRGWFRKRATELVVKNAEAILPVSITLQKAMEEKGLKHNNYQIVNNVVDDFFFTQPILNNRHEKVRFLHISCFCEEAKNVKGILDAVRILAKQRDDFELTIVGTGVDYEEVYNYAEKLEVLDSVHFTGEKTPEEVMEHFRQSDAFVLNSNFETSGVVIMESLAMGKPVITTPVGIAPQAVNEKNGIYTPLRNPAALAEKMDWMANHHHEYDAQEIRRQAYAFSLKAVSGQLREIYRKATE